MALADLGLNRSRSAIVFVVPESVNGTIDTARTNSLLDRPQHTSDTNTDAFGLVSVPVIGQQGNYSDTSEIGPELITTDRVLNYMEYSTFDFEYYAKPGGRTLATAITGGTALPTCLYFDASFPLNFSLSGKLCALAASLTVITLSWVG